MKFKAFIEGTLKCRRGSTIVEAAIILPVVILAVISAVITVVFISNMVFSGVNVDEFLRLKTGELSGTVREAEYIREYDFEKSRKNLTPALRIDRIEKIRGGGLVDKLLMGKIRQSGYKLREKNYILYKDLFNGYFKE